MKLNLQELFPVNLVLRLVLPAPATVRCKNAGCRACGNPAYPYCKDSCPMFDD